MRLVSSLLLLLLVAWLAAPSAASVTWKKTNPTVTVADLNDITYGAGLYLAVGGNRLTIVTSTDLQSWEAAKVPYEARIDEGTWSIAYGPEAGFVITSGFSEATLVSKDGKEWTRHVQPFSTSRCDVIYGNGVYVAGPRDFTPGKVAVSKDGIAWTYHNVIPYDPLQQSSIHGVSLVNGLFVAYGSDGQSTGALYSSVDGKSWSLYRNITESYPGLIYQILDLQAGSSTTLVALVSFSNYTALLTSTDDGHTWKATLRSPYSGLGGPLSSGNGVFFASLWNGTFNSYTTMASFDNGRSWGPAPKTLVSHASVPQYVRGQFVNVFKSGLIQLSHDNGRTFKSLDEGITTPFYSFISTPPGYELNGHSFFVQTYNPSAILGSADGVEWSEVVTLSKALDQLTYYSELGAWVATDSQQLVISKDLVDWRTLGGPNIPPIDGDSITLTAFARQDDGAWLALFNFWNHWASDYTLYRSSNGTLSAPWTAVTSGMERAQDVEVGNGAIVVLTVYGDLQLSTNGGCTWRKHPGPGGQLASIQYVAKAFVAVGQDERSVYISSDSQAWTGFRFADAPQALVQANVFVVEVDGEERPAVSLTDGSIRTYDATTKTWAEWTTIPNSFDGVDGVRSSPKGVFVAVNTLNNEVFTTALYNIF